MPEMLPNNRHPAIEEDLTAKEKVTSATAMTAYWGTYSMGASGRAGLDHVWQLNVLDDYYDWAGATLKEKLSQIVRVDFSQHLRSNRANCWRSGDVEGR
jgi:hypothetical protein